MPKVLLVDDDPKIISAIEKTLSLEESYVFKAAGSPEQAVSEALRYKPDLILLDIRLGGADGRVILKTLKENAATRAIPVIFLTGLASEGDKVLGLNLGADDYLAKPFGAMELLARIQAVLRRAGPESSQHGTLKAGGLELDSLRHTVSYRGRPLRLQPREFEILYLLAANAGRTLSRSFLIENSSSYGMEVSSRSLDTHIKNLRKKLGAGSAMIETVPKMGYRFDAPRHA